MKFPKRTERSAAATIILLPLFVLLFTTIGFAVGYEMGKTRVMDSMVKHFKEAGDIPAHRLPPDVAKAMAKSVQRGYSNR